MHSVAQLLLPVCCCCLFGSTTASLDLDLSGNWTLSPASSNGTFLARIPGSVYSALIDNKVIDDPYYGFNDIHYEWIGKTNWTFEKTFTVSSDMLSRKSVMLVCDGLDTISTILINGKLVGSSVSMFVQYIFDIKQFIKVGTNHIMVAFQSAVNYAAQKAQHSPYTIPPTCPPPMQHGQCYVNLIRKEQCSFSWDWGPSFPTQGIWRKISIQAYNSSMIKAVTAETSKNSSGGWLLNVEVFFEVDSHHSTTGQIELRIDDLQIHHLRSVSISSNIPSVKIPISLSKVKVEQWWPNGYGRQKLYVTDVIFTSTGAKEIWAKRIKVGFRTVELVQDPVSKNKTDGLSFYFKINGLPVFFKGSNWIPADSFQERVTSGRIRNLLQAAVDTHQNSLRVWGGGVYESDEFYDIADEMGLMIWQDFMFAVALYPADLAFLDTVKDEITYQIRRLKYHPSIVLWAGNNENELALSADWFGTYLQFDKYKRDYIKLYVNTVKPIVETEDKSRPFLCSSPSNGKESEYKGWISKNPGDILYGDVHYYNYLDDLWDVKTFPIPRFASEYGVQAWCSFEALELVFNATELYYWSPLSEHRQHHMLGNLQMLAATALHFDLPYTKNLTQRLAYFIYLIQINQAMSIRTETETYRRHQSELIGNKGLTMGALYWQLNDIWQAPTWSSIEYGGKWKMLHYYARHFFAPVLISPYLSDNNLTVYIVLDEVPVMEYRQDASNRLQFLLSHPSTPSITKNEITETNYVYYESRAATPTLKPFTGTLHIDLYQWKNRTPVHSWSQPFKVVKTSESVFSQSLSVMLKGDTCYRHQSCFFYFHLESHGTEVNSWLPLHRFEAGSTIPKAKIKIDDVIQDPHSNSTFTVAMSADSIAPFVWLEARGIQGRFSDNGFLMIKPKLNLKFYAWELVMPPKLKASLSVISLMDVY